jgi:hypothetical protein
MDCSPIMCLVCSSAEAGGKLMPVHVCACPRLVHASCLKLWQLHSYGR